MQQPAASSLLLAPHPHAQALDAALQWLDGLAREHAWPPRQAFALRLCLDEALTNVLSYAYGANPQGGQIELRCACAGAQIVLEIFDDGAAYDPSARAPAELATSLEDAVAGGHGLRILSHYLKNLSYSYHDGRNCLRMEI